MNTNKCYACGKVCDGKICRRCYTTQEYRISEEDAFRKVYMIKSHRTAGYITTPKSLIGKRVKLIDVSNLTQEHKR